MARLLRKTVGGVLRQTLDTAREVRLSSTKSPSGIRKGPGGLPHTISTSTKNLARLPDRLIDFDLLTSFDLYRVRFTERVLLELGNNVDT
jgi:hypothetical protein